MLITVYSYAVHTIYKGYDTQITIHILKYHVNIICHITLKMFLPSGTHMENTYSHLNLIP